MLSWCLWLTVRRPLSRGERIFQGIAAMWYPQKAAVCAHLLVRAKVWVSAAQLFISLWFLQACLGASGLYRDASIHWIIQDCKAKRKHRSIQPGQKIQHRCCYCDTKVFGRVGEAKSIKPHHDTAVTSSTLRWDLPLPHSSQSCRMLLGGLLRGIPITCLNQSIARGRAGHSVTQVLSLLRLL